MTRCGGCGEVVNTADCGSVMRGFDPHHSPHFLHKSIRFAGEDSFSIMGV